MAAYHSGRPLVAALTLFVSFRLFLYAVAIGLWCTAVDVQDFAVVGLIEGGGIILYLIAAILFLIWVHGATRNLLALGSESLQISPSDAVLGYIIPVINLVRGHQVMANLWIESQPVPEDRAHLPRQTRLVNLWWGLHLLGIAATFVIRTSHSVRHMQHRLAVLDTVFLVSGIFFLWVVRAVQSRQDEQWKDIRLRNAVPAPAADVLR